MRFDARTAPLALGAAFLVLALHGLGAAPITGDDEAREAGIVQDVLAGHWLWPRFNAELIPDKPVLFHWLAAVPCALAGFSEATVRLPSAIAAAALVAWTTRFGIAVLGFGPGVAAGALLATFPAYSARARTARPDALMLLLLAAALGFAFRVHREGRPRDATAALALLGVATLAKGPVAPALFVLTLVPFLAWEGALGRLRDYVTGPGLAAVVVFGGGWYVLALSGWGEEFVRQHLVGRYLRNLAGGLVEGHAYSPKSFAYHATFYPLHLFAIALPWTPLIVAALVRLARRRAFASPLVRFLVCWTLAPLIAFTPAEYKLRYYLLPCLPPLALLAAPLAAELLARPVGAPRATRASFVAAVLVLVAGGVMAWLPLAHPALLSRSDQASLSDVLATVPGGGWTAAAIAGALLGVAGAAVALRLWGPIVALTGTLAIGWLAVGAPNVGARSAGPASLRDFALAVRERFPAGAPLAFYGPPVRSVVVYVGRPIPSLERSADRITAGLGVIATEPAYRALARHDRAGAVLATGSGTIGNLDQGTLVLAEGRPAPR